MTVLLAFAVAIIFAQLLFAIALGYGERRGKANRRDLADRAAVRARADEALARHQTAPFVDIDVEPRRRG